MTRSERRLLLVQAQLRVRAAMDLLDETDPDDDEAYVYAMARADDAERTARDARAIDSEWRE